jgi:hypothetical protein
VKAGDVEMLQDLSHRRGQRSRRARSIRSHAIEPWEECLGGLGGMRGLLSHRVSPVISESKLIALDSQTPDHQLTRLVPYV